MSSPEWLTDYYNRLQGDYQSSFKRRDNVTNWAYTLLAAVLAIYFGFFSDSFPTQPLWRFSFVLGILVIMIRFFFQSMIAYGFILKYRYLKTQIEKHWMNNDPNMTQVKDYINKFDHSKAMPPTGRNRFFDGQVRSGFIITILIPLILLVNELYITLNNIPNIYGLLFIGIIVYVSLETLNFILYDQMKKE